ncbi:cation diffusion facilitator family transporter [Novosphingobium panipatense]
MSRRFAVSLSRSGGRHHDGHRCRNRHRRERFVRVALCERRRSDINLRAAFVHLMADALVSVGVVIAGLLIRWTGEALIDPVTSLIITAVIAWSSWGLLRDLLRMGMLGVPEGIDAAKVRALLESQPGVMRVHDLHIWPMSTTETALTAHLVMPQGQPGNSFLHRVAEQLEHDFGIAHSTLQVEFDDHGGCPLENEAAV